VSNLRARSRKVCLCYNNPMNIILSCRSSVPGDVRVEDPGGAPANEVKATADARTGWTGLSSAGEKNSPGQTVWRPAETRR
jgi:hypothetical protein